MHLSPPIRVALVGYGLAGKTFHAPLIAGIPELRLQCVVSRQREAVQQDWPEVHVLEELGQALASDDIEMVVIATPNTLHFPQAQAALMAGKHVVIDKPCTVTLQETETLLALAEQRGLMLSVFQNRRWDADFLTLQQVLASGDLGRVVYVESHFDRYRPTVPVRWRDQDLPGSGLWYDLGSHLLDQALVLWGTPQSVHLDRARLRDGALSHDYFHALLDYGQDLRVVLHATALAPLRGPRFIVHGTRGSFVKYGLDPQEDALKAGGRPQWGQLGTWGLDPEPAQVCIYPQAENAHLLEPQIYSPQTQAGNYLSYYHAVAQHLQGRGPNPVSATQIRTLMSLLVS